MIIVKIILVLLTLWLMYKVCNSYNTSDGGKIFLMLVLFAFLANVLGCNNCDNSSDNYWDDPPGIIFRD
jgi:hypothetical protein